MSKRKPAQAEGGNVRPLAARRDEPKVKIRTPKDIVPLCGHITHAEQEVVLVFTLDGANQVTTSHMVTVGLANQSQIHPREVFKHAIRHNSVSIIVVHNHPSGNLEPSESDLIATRRLVEVAKTIGIPLLDHVIMSPDGFMSLRDRYPGYFG
jgi:DNA repair protein RadC